MAARGKRRCPRCDEFRFTSEVSTCVSCKATACCWCFEGAVDDTAVHCLSACKTCDKFVCGGPGCLVVRYCYTCMDYCCVDCEPLRVCMGVKTSYGDPGRQHHCGQELGCSRYCADWDGATCCDECKRNYCDHCYDGKESTYCLVCDKQFCEDCSNSGGRCECSENTLWQLVPRDN